MERIEPFVDSSDKTKKQSKQVKEKNKTSIIRQIEKWIFIGLLLFIPIAIFISKAKFIRFISN